VPSIVEALIEAYEAPRGVSDQAVAFADQYRADKVYDAYWKPIMKELTAWCQSSSSPS
jgi:hypothetical protein